MGPGSGSNQLDLNDARGIVGIVRAAKYYTVHVLRWTAVQTSIFASLTILKLPIESIFIECAF